MPPSPDRPTVHLVHGAGLDQTSFADLADRLAGAGVTAVMAARRGYDHRCPTDDLDRHVDDLEERIGRGPAVVVGVSGGATLALELALRNRPAVTRVVAHEPLIGPSAAEQHAVVTGSIGTLLDEPGPAAVGRFVARLITPQLWDRLPAAVRDRVLGHAAAIRREAAGFARFAAAPARLAARTTPLTWTVGSDSPGWRHDAAVIGAGAGAELRVLPAVHTPQLECPERLAHLIVEEATR